MFVHLLRAFYTFKVLCGILEQSQMLREQSEVTESITGHTHTIHSQRFRVYHRLKHASLWSIWRKKNHTPSVWPGIFKVFRANTSSLLWGDCAIDGAGASHTEPGGWLLMHEDPPDPPQPSVSSAAGSMSVKFCCTQSASLEHTSKITLVDLWPHNWYLGCVCDRISATCNVPAINC